MLFYDAIYTSIGNKSLQKKSAVLSLKTMSATRLYTNLDIPESRNLIDRHTGDESFPKIMDMFRNLQGTVEEQMFRNR
jgi:hypothetical protein